jgi:hypothetical protein
MNELRYWHYMRLSQHFLSSLILEYALWICAPHFEADRKIEARPNKTTDETISAFAEIIPSVAWIQLRLATI